MEVLEPNRKLFPDHSPFILLHGELVALPFTLKSIFKAKEELWEIQIFSPCKNIIFE
jgi:hypothetical protein